MDNMTTIYEEDFNRTGNWVNLLERLELPSDTDEICIKHISHVTKTQRKEQREKQNATDDNRT